MTIVKNQIETQALGILERILEGEHHNSMPEKVRLLAMDEANRDPQASHQFCSKVIMCGHAAEVYIEWMARARQNVTERGTYWLDHKEG